MRTVQFSCTVLSPIGSVAQYHSTVQTLFRLTPPSRHARLEGEAAPMAPGVVYHIVVKQFGFIPIHIHSRIERMDMPNLFQDCQLPGKGPFKYWCHTHQFTAINGTTTLITDTIEYSMPFGPLGQLVDWLVVSADLKRLFDYRHKITRQDLEAK